MSANSPTSTTTPPRAATPTPLPLPPSPDAEIERLLEQLALERALLETKSRDAAAAMTTLHDQVDELESTRATAISDVDAHNTAGLSPTATGSTGTWVYSPSPSPSSSSPPRPACSARKAATPRARYVAKMRLIACLLAIGAGRRGSSAKARAKGAVIRVCAARLHAALARVVDGAERRSLMR